MNYRETLARLPRHLLRFPVTSITLTLPSPLYLILHSLSTQISSINHYSTYLFYELFLSIFSSLLQPSKYSALYPIGNISERLFNSCKSKRFRLLHLQVLSLLCNFDYMPANHVQSVFSISGLKTHSSGDINIKCHQTRTEKKIIVVLKVATHQLDSQFYCCFESHLTNVYQVSKIKGTQRI